MLMRLCTSMTYGQFCTLYNFQIDLAHRWMDYQSCLPTKTKFPSRLIQFLKAKDEKPTTFWILVRVLLVEVDVCTKRLY